MNKLFLLCIACMLSFVMIERADAQQINVLTYNVNACRNEAGKVDVAKTAKVIADANVDLAAIQEVDVNTGRTRNVDQAKELAKLTQMPYHHFAKGIDLQGGEYGILILSKFPIKDSFRIELPRKSGEQRVLSGVQVELPNTKNIVFMNTNISGSQADKLAYVEEIISASKATDLPIILAGDFGTMPGAPEINALDQNFTRTCPTEDCPKVYPVKAPTRAISHIMYTPNSFKTLSHNVIDEKRDYASDKRPVVAEVELL